MLGESENFIGTTVGYGSDFVFGSEEVLMVRPVCWSRRLAIALASTALSASVGLAVWASPESAWTCP